MKLEILKEVVDTRNDEAAAQHSGAEYDETTFVFERQKREKNSSEKQNRKRDPQCRRIVVVLQ